MAKIILASRSLARQTMLKGAGLNFKTVPADIDEASIKRKAYADGAGIADLASLLALEKALKVSKDHPSDLVIGSDQILEFGGRVLSKAKDKKDALDKLKELSGGTHTLISAVVVAKESEILWEHSDQAHLTMHDFSDRFLNAYCEKAGDVLTTCVGGYALEQHGSWLFSKIEGDYFTVLGMPLCPLLLYLRTEQGITL